MRKQNYVRNLYLSATIINMTENERKKNINLKKLVSLRTQCENRNKKKYIRSEQLIHFHGKRKLKQKKIFDIK